MTRTAKSAVPRRYLGDMSVARGTGPALVGHGEFVALFKERPLPHMEGAAGAAFLVYHGERAPARAGRAP